METKRIQRLRRYLTQRFAVIAILTSLLVANSGSGNIFLPALVLLVTITSYILVDWLDVFHFGRIGSYIGMSVASLIAMVTLIVSVFRSSEAGQLMAVASLLIYPQCVLFFQKKNMRVFEQLAIFFLLQMIVAALINDNYIYGLLLTPILLLWVSSLLLLSRYATLVDVAPEIDKPVPLLYELFYQRYLSSMRRSSAKLALVTSAAQLDAVVTTVHQKRRIFLTIPLAMASLAFAGALFCLLPRAPGEAHLAIEEKQIGLSKQISIGSFGRVLSDPAPVMRLKLSSSDGTTYQTMEPPYLRVGVADTYNPPIRAYEPGYWTVQQYHVPHQSLPDLQEDSLIEPVRVEVSFRKGYRQELICIPPLIEKPDHLVYRLSDMIFDDQRQFEIKKWRTQSYHFVSAAFSQGRQLKVLPDYERTVRPSVSAPLPKVMPLANLKRMEILKKAGIASDQAGPGAPRRQRYKITKALEGHLRDSGEYTYTLDVPPPVDAYIDPIEDFLVNVKTGLCQSYAGALVALLRQSGIPSRIVVGYVATQRNRLGQHFIVRQSDAHAWVEARFSRDELEGTECEPWLGTAQHYWVQLDASPTIDDQRREIIESRQSLEYADKLWEDYVSGSDKITQMGLYENVADSSKDLMENLFSDWTFLRSGIGTGLTQFQRMDFAWPAAIGVFGLGVAAIIFWQVAVWLPRIAPDLSRRLGIYRRRPSSVQHVFYARCLSMLESLQIVRSDSETLLEFSQRSRQKLTTLADGQSADVSRSLDFLNSWYHRLRFGSHEILSAEVKRQLEQHLQVIDGAVRAARGRI